MTDSELEMAEQLKKDLKAFADPGSEVEVGGREVRWRRRGHGFVARLERSQSAPSGPFPDFVYEGARYDYAQFFGHRELGHLQFLAESILAQTEEAAHYVEGRVRYQEEEFHAAKLHEFSTQDLPLFGTKVSLLRGDAGAGKSALLRHLTRAAAAGFEPEKHRPLLFYVDAQGRALSRLDEAISVVKDDLGAAFHYDAVATLTRLGLVVPVIDGFDELLGTTGYADAFSSLTTFLRKLNGSGAMIISARSTFYEFSDLSRVRPGGARTGEADFNYQLVTVDMLPWGERELTAYAEKRGSASGSGEQGTPDVMESIAKHVAADEREAILSTPFFVERLFELVERGVTISSSLIEAVVNDLLSREVDKWKGSSGQPVLTLAQHSRLLESLAEEMIYQESLALDQGTVQTVAELVAESLELGSESARITRSKLPNHGILQVSSDRGVSRLAFRHEKYFAYFAGSHVARCIREGNPLADVLARTGLSAPAIEEAVRILVSDGKVVPEDIIRTLSERKLSVLTQDTSRRNAGTLVSHLFVRAKSVSGEPSEPLVVRAATIEHSSWAGARLAHLAFDDCDLVSVDATHATLVGVNFSEARLQDLAVNGTELRDCEFGEAGPLGLRVLEDGATRKLYEPQAVQEALGKRGARVVEAGHDQPAPPSERAAKLMSLFDRFLSLTTSTYYFSESDLKNRGIAQAEAWKELLNLMRRHGLIETRRISRSGSKGDVMTFVPSPQDVELIRAGRGGEGELWSFWKAVREG